MNGSTAVEPRRARRASASWALLWSATVVASTAAIFIRYASGAGPLAIAFWRCALGALALAPFARSQLAAVPRRRLAVSAVAGAFLALHFGTWIASVDLTTIAASVLLVSTTPVFVALAAWLLFGDRLPLAGWAGIALAMAGAGAVVLAAAGGGGESSLLGNFLALVGGAAAAGYLLAGQEARKGVGILAYAVIAYGAAAVLLLGVCVAAGVPLAGYPAATWLAIALIVLGPQLLGHTLINFVLKDMDATTIAVTILIEPIVATALALVLFSELPSWLVFPGGVALLAGVYLVSKVRRPPAVVVE